LTCVPVFRFSRFESILPPSFVVVVNIVKTSRLIKIVRYISATGVQTNVDEISDTSKSIFFPAAHNKPLNTDEYNTKYIVNVYRVCDMCAGEWVRECLQTLLLIVIVYNITRPECNWSTTIIDNAVVPLYLSSRIFYFMTVYKNSIRTTRTN